MAQAEALDRELAVRGTALDAVLELTVDEDVLLVRIKGRAEQAENNGEPVRRDDTPEVFKTRFKAYRAQTAPVTDYYRSKGLLHVVNGLQPIDGVTEKRTVTPGTGLPKASLTVAVTQCLVSTGLVAVFGLSVRLAGCPGVTFTLMTWVARRAPSTTAVTVHEKFPGTAGAVTVSTNEISTGAVNGPYGGGGVKLTLKPGGLQLTSKSTRLICAALALTRLTISSERLEPLPASTASPPVAPASCL